MSLGVEASTCRYFVLTPPRADLSRVKCRSRTDR